jgi:hypothetical protein
MSAYSQKRTLMKNPNSLRHHQFQDKQEILDPHFQADRPAR